MSDVEYMKNLLVQLDERLSQTERSLKDLQPPCEKCAGSHGEAMQLVGGYETILCRACRNAWAVALDESGLWLEYHKAVATAKVRRDVIKARARSTATLSANDIDEVVNVYTTHLVAVEREIFQLAARWIAGGAP